jgi:Cu/Ag efflux pump CusA
LDSTRAQDFRNRPQEIEEIGARVEALLPTPRGTRSVFAQPTQTGYFLDIDWKPEELARNGLAIEQAHQVLETRV